MVPLDLLANQIPGDALGGGEFDLRVGDECRVLWIEMHGFFLRNEALMSLEGWRSASRQAKAVAWSTVAPRGADRVGNSRLVVSSNRWMR